MAETLQDFLISIGYKVDEASQTKMQAGLKNNTFLAVEMGRVFLKAADDVVRAAERMAKGLDELYFTSLRTGAAVESIKAMQYAAAQLGSSGGAALSALESVAKLMATNPAGEGFLNSLGVKTRDANHALMDTGKIMQNLGSVLKNMPMSSANYIASFLGIDYRTLIAMREGLGAYSAEYERMYAAAHINGQQAAKDANYLMTQIRGLGAAFDVLGDKVTANMSRRMGDDIKKFRDFIVLHFDEIAHVIEVVANAVLFIAGTITRLAIDAGQGFDHLVTWFKSLDVGTKNLILSVLAIGAAWKALNLVFEASPIGRLLMLAFALTLLYDDYKAWKAGAESLIDWKAWEPAIIATQKGMIAIGHEFNLLWIEITTDLIPSLEQLAKQLGLTGLTFSGSFKDGITEILSGLKQMVHYLTDVVRLYSAIARGDWVEALKAAQAIAYNDLGLPQHAPEAGGEQTPGTPSFWQRVGSGIRRALPTWAGGDGPIEAPKTNAQQNASAERGASVWINAGASREGAAAMMGTVEQESSFATASNTQGHVGRYQWSQERQARIMREFSNGKPIAAMSADEQDAAAAWEMKKYYPTAWAAVQSGNLEAAVRAVTETFEIPELPGTAKSEAEVAHRTQLARNRLSVLPRIGPQGIPTLTTPDRSGTTPLQNLGKRLAEQGAANPSSPYSGMQLDIPPLVSSPSPGATTILNQDTDIHVDARGNPDLVPDRIGGAQQRVNESVVRNLTGALR